MVWCATNNNRNNNNRNNNTITLCTEMVPVPFIKRSLLAWLKKAFLNATLSQGQTLRDNCLMWTVTEGGWKIHQGPRGRGFSLPISSKSTAKNNTIAMPRTSVLTQALGSSHDADLVKISSEPESKGSFTAIQKPLLGSSAGLGGPWGRMLKNKWAPPLHAWATTSVSFLLTQAPVTVHRQALCTGPGKVSRAEHGRGVVCKLTEKWM